MRKALVGAAIALVGLLGAAGSWHHYGSNHHYRPAHIRAERKAAFHHYMPRAEMY
jgi:hypothetical protein